VLQPPDLNDYTPVSDPDFDLFAGRFPGAGPVNQAVDDVLIGYDFVQLEDGVLGTAGPTRTRKNFEQKSESTIAGKSISELYRISFCHCNRFILTCFCTLRVHGI
jgi:hypothetical protein